MQRSGSRDGAAHGGIRIRTLLALLLVIPLGYLAVKYGPPYWGYVSMLSPVRETALAAAGQRWDANPQIELSRRQWKDALVARAETLGVDLGDQDVTIERIGSEAVVRAAWQVPVRHPYGRHVLTFRVESRQAFLPQ